MFALMFAMLAVFALASPFIVVLLVMQENLRHRLFRLRVRRPRRRREV
jgi:hypothetical protein